MSRTVRSRLVKYRASGINPDTGERDVWEVSFIGNSREDRNFWLIMAKEAGFTEISLTKVVPPKTDKPHKLRNSEIVLDPDIAREALKLLDSLIAARKAKTA